MDNLAQSQVLEEELENRGLSRTSLLYQDKTCLIYSGMQVSESGRESVSIHVKAYLTNSECAVVKREFEILKTIPENPNLIRIQRYFFFEYLRGQYFFVCITELPSKTIHHDITLRSTSQLPWEDYKLLEVAKQLIEAFSLLQIHGIVHRDIKPQNLFLDSEFRPKIGGFGSSRSITALEAADYSTHGSAFYMGPELKQLQNDGHAGRTVFSRVKADVYSLGMTLLYMYTRTPPTSLLNLGTLQNETEIALQTVLDPSLKQLLTLMLTIHPNSRPDFQQLTQFFSQEITQPKVSGPLGLIGCRHAARGAEFCFTFPCHGQYCRDCSPAVSFMVYLNDRSWYQLKCPICMETYEMCWDEQQPNEVKIQDESESAFKLSTDHPSELLSSLGEGKMPIFNRCLWCKQRLDASVSRNPLKSILILNCVHRFCSQNCFCNFYEFASNSYQDFDVRCSACPLFIPKELAEDFYGGHFVFQRVMEASVHGNCICRICRANIGTHRLHETHWYCSDCHRFMALPKQAHCVSCSDCTAEIKMSDSMRTEQQSGCCCFRWCPSAEDETEVKPKQVRRYKKRKNDEEATVMQEK